MKFLRSGDFELFTGNHNKALHPMGLRRIGELFVRPRDTMKSFIRNLSAPAEFFLVILVCFWWGIIGSIGAVASHLLGSQLGGRVHRQRGTYFGHPRIVGLSRHILVSPQPSHTITPP